MEVWRHLTNQRISRAGTWRTFPTVACVLLCCLGTALIAVLRFTPEDDDFALLQKMRGTKPPVKYYWIPVEEPGLHINFGQLLEESSDLSNNASNATNSSNATNATNKNVPPYGEPMELPPPECDLSAMSDCLGAFEAQINALTEATSSSDETADFFCRNAQEPFQCACRACKLDQLGQWDDVYYHSNVTYRVKQLLSTMRVEAQCHKLNQVGARNFPAGHGCNMLYQTLCTDPYVVDRKTRAVLEGRQAFSSHFCPRVLSPWVRSSRLGLARTLLNDNAFWIDSRRTCKAPHRWTDELQCKHQYAVDLRGGICGRRRRYLICLCDACERDVGRTVTDMSRWWGCEGGNWTVDGPNATDAEDCAQWKDAECEVPLEADYCSKLNGTKAYLRLLPQAEPAPSTYDQDGISWLNLCHNMVEPMADNPDLLEGLLGPGWISWCKAYILSQGQPWGPQPGPVPNGVGLKGHVRLPVSGLPAPRRDDHDDVDVGAEPVTCPGPECWP